MSPVDLCSMLVEKLLVLEIVISAAGLIFSTIVFILFVKHCYKCST